MKFLIFVLIVWGVIHLLRHRSVVASQSRTYSRTGAPQGQAAKTITMVQCEHCGVYLPENEAIIRQGHVWCCAEHERLGKRMS